MLGFCILSYALSAADGMRLPLIVPQPLVSVACSCLVTFPPLASLQVATVQVDAVVAALVARREGYSRL